MHADGDSFFAACEVAAHPEYRGLPVVVGQDKGMAIAMTYEAKALGIHRGMPVFKIKKLFPQAIILSHHFELYRTISKKVQQILLENLEFVERGSIDECFAGVRESDIRFFGSERALVESIKKEIFDMTGVPYSFGLARTKALAKTASKLKKPNGVVLLLSVEDERAALAGTQIEDVWGIGRRTAPRFKNKGIHTAYDMTQLGDEELIKHFSTSHLTLKYELLGTSLYKLAPHTDPRDQKSIQSTSTFRPASSDPKMIWAELSENTEGAAKHARKLRLVTNAASFFVKSSQFKYRFADVRLPLYTADPGIVLNAIETKFLPILLPGEEIRATGVILHNLRREEDVQRDLFGVQEAAIKRMDVELAADKLRQKFGSDVVRRLASLKARQHDNDCSFKRV